MASEDDYRQRVRNGVRGNPEMWTRARNRACWRAARFATIAVCPSGLNAVFKPEAWEKAAAQERHSARVINEELQAAAA